MVPMPKTRVTPRPPLQKTRQGKNRRAKTSAPLESLVVYTWFVVTPAIVLRDEVDTAEKLVIVGNPGGTIIAPPELELEWAVFCCDLVEGGMLALSLVVGELELLPDFEVGPAAPLDFVEELDPDDPESWLEAPEAEDPELDSDEVRLALGVERLKPPTLDELE